MTTSTTITAEEVDAARAELLEHRRRAAAPMLLTLAAGMVSGTSPRLDAVTLGLPVRANPVPDALLAGALGALAELASDLADALDPGPQR